MPQTRTIAVDARTLTYVETAERGIGTFTICHIDSWAKLRPQTNFKLLIEKGDSLIRGEELFSLPNVVKEYYSLAGDEFADVDLFHVPDPMSVIEGYDSPFRMAPKGIRSTVLFHDLIPLAIKNAHYDNWHPNIRKSYDVKLEHVKSSKAHILANSEATKRDLINLVGIEARNISVVMAGLAGGMPELPSDSKVQEIKAGLGINKPYILVVGGLDRHKGFLITLEASFPLLKSGTLQLVIVGSMIDPFKIQLKESALKGNLPGVILTGFLSDEQLACLYKDAVALSFPSEYEGFGFPVLEAMAHGCPVICSDRASLPEVAGDAALYLESLNANHLLNSYQTLLLTPGLRESLIEKGRQRARLFTWEAVAQRTIAAIEQIERL